MILHTYFSPFFPSFSTHPAKLSKQDEQVSHIKTSSFSSHAGTFTVGKISYEFSGKYKLLDVPNRLNQLSC